ncbi:hypothetical protein H4217_006703 [Coemansia sp. RSA 1939]|nr:hypothetical protein H4217_006703 [Coemansia sp. RSA 1939]KAJ2610026.1 hypothetical protein EV177_004174 [Coemansia sp. RSA 1804]
MYSSASQGHCWRPFSNPAPLGNSGFAVATFVSSLHTGAIGIASGAPPNIVVGLALFYGGFAQVLAGAWAFASNSAFGAIVFTSYGCYWMSYAAILIPGFGISDALGAVSDTIRAESLGIFYLVWTIQTFIFLLGSSRSNWGTFILLLFLFVGNLLTCIGKWSQNERILHGSGYVGMFTSFIAWYNVAVDMLTKETFYFSLPNPEMGIRGMESGESRSATHSPLFHGVFQPHVSSKLDGHTPRNHFDFAAPILESAAKTNCNDSAGKAIVVASTSHITAQDTSGCGGCTRSESIEQHDIAMFRSG